MLYSQGHSKRAHTQQTSSKENQSSGVERLSSVSEAEFKPQYSSNKQTNHNKKFNNKAKDKRFLGEPVMCCGWY